jgi:hypothetical protein
MKKEYHRSLLAGFQLQHDEDKLNDQRGDREKIVACDWHVLGIEEMGAEQQCQHRTAEETGPGLLQTEPQKFVKGGGDPAVGGGQRAQLSLPFKKDARPAHSSPRSSQPCLRPDATPWRLRGTLATWDSWQDRRQFGSRFFRNVA